MHTFVPLLDAHVRQIRFSPSNTDLYVLMADDALVCFQVESKSFKRTGLPDLKSIASDRPLVGLTFDPNSSSECYTYGRDCFLKLNLDAPRTEHRTNGHVSELSSSNGLPASKKAKKKRKIAVTEYGALCHIYGPILAIDFLDAGEMVIVERPLEAVAEKLPAPFVRRRYDL